jgi:hypothetical protein
MGGVLIYARETNHQKRNDERNKEVFGLDKISDIQRDRRVADACDMNFMRSVGGNHHLKEGKYASFGAL